MLNLKIGENEYSVKFAYEPVIKSKLISKLAKIEKSTQGDNDDNLQMAEDIMMLLPEMLLIGLQKYHRDEFGYDYENNEEKAEKLDLVFKLIDDYFEEESPDFLGLFNQLQEEMLNNSFLSSLFGKEVQKKLPKKSK
jgi:hypothetical protein